MIDRDILLLLIGSGLGAASSLATLLVIYMIEGMRLRRKWRREDHVALRQTREDLNALLARVGEKGPAEEDDSGDASEA